MPKRFKSPNNNIEMKEKGKATFQSYIDLTDEENEEKDSLSGSKNKESHSSKEEVQKRSDAFFKHVEPRKLQGEEVIAKVDTVLMYAPYTDHKQALYGHLFVTNFKISFVTADKSSYPDGSNNKSNQRNKLLDNSDVSLTCVDSVYQVISGGRKRKLLPRTTISSPTKYLEIHCKDFQIHVFGFKFAKKEETTQVINAIMHHAFPCKDNLMFAFTFGHSCQFEESSQALFYDARSWSDELDRLHCDLSLWRITQVNQAYKMSLSLPQYFVVPSKLLDTDIQNAANQFVNKRVPVWSYTYSTNGASLVRMSSILQNSDLKNVAEKCLSAVKQASGSDKDLIVLDLSKECPPLSEIRSGYEKLKSLVMSESAIDFYSSDSRWLSSLESSRWLHLVSNSLSIANKTTKLLVNEAQTVVLKEESGCDLVCLVSCLAQIQIDPDYRTLSGFQQLVQREWVAMGHPFQKRLGFLHNLEIGDAEEAPIFLLFLDCIWQLMRQFPSSFNFTETYLTTLWDTIHLGLFDNFLFNNSRHRDKFLHEGVKLKHISLPTAWDLKFILGEDQLLLFNNPLYMLTSSESIENVKSEQRSSGKISRSSRYSLNLGSSLPISTFSKPQDMVLKSDPRAPFVKLWTLLYLRWAIPAQIVGGGNPSQYVQQCVIAEEILFLQHKLGLLREQAKQLKPDREAGDFGSNKLQLALREPRPNSGLIFGLSNNQPVVELSTTYITSSFPFTTGISQQTQHTLICGPLSQYLKGTAIDHVYEADEND